MITLTKKVAQCPARLLYIQKRKHKIRFSSLFHSHGGHGAIGNYIPYRLYSYCVMDDVIVSIAISITELYGQLSGKRMVLYITKAVKRSSLVFGNNIIMFTYQVCCL